MTDTERLGGFTRYWREGDFLYAENSIAKMAHVITDDPKLIGTCGWHGPDQIWVEYVSRETAKTWGDY